MSAVNDRLSYTCPVLLRICLFSLASTLHFQKYLLSQLNSNRSYIPTRHRNVLPTASNQQKKERAHSLERFNHNTSMSNCKPVYQATAQIIIII
jgi:hypothetical protein